MSRITLYEDSRFTVITGIDHILGKFYQLYDREMQNETPEQEGIVVDWSEAYGYDRNFTGIPEDKNVLVVINNYINENIDDNEIIFEVNLN